MAVNTVINQIIVLFLMIFAGFLAKKKGIISGASRKKLSELLLNITNPLLIISSFQFEFSREILQNVLIVLVFAIVAHALQILLGKLLFIKSEGGAKQIGELSAIYTNCGFMGFPVLESLYGKIGILYGSVYSAVFNVYLWTHGVMVLNGKGGAKSVKKILLNPGIISVVIGLLIFFFSIKLPYPLAQAMELLGDMTIPLSMLIVGATLADADFKKLFSGFNLYYITGIRLILMPLLAIMILKLFSLSEVLMGTCVLFIAMPVATTVSIFAEMYNGDTELASRVVVFSTLLSAFTIPLMIALL
jgi:predicted permease